MLDRLFTKTSFIVRKLFPQYTWKLPKEIKTVYLTFDDGPIPEITPWLIELLKSENIKGTFFCIGENIQKHPDVFLELIKNGHSIGNHTYTHLNGWKNSLTKYEEDTMKCEEILHDYGVHTKLFRPPYGKIRNEAANSLHQVGYKIIMWDVLSRDYNRNMSPEHCFKNVIQNVENGSIIVFHDSIKAQKNLMYALPKVIHFLKREGYNFEVL